MNSKKKIIDTLQNADKASVEKLMAGEAKRDEIFARAMKRASEGSESVPGDTVSGVEHYDRKISITRMVSIAAAAVLVTGGIFGAVHFMMRDNNRRTGEITEVSVEDMIGSSTEVPYENIMDLTNFKLAFDNYTDPENPLQLTNGTYQDAVVAKPYKSVIVDNNKVIAPHNIWHFPVVHENSCIGFINCDMRFSDNLEAAIYGGEQYADTLNDALKKGNIAVFNTTKGTYGIYEDDSVITIESTEDYKGTITFNDVNKGYNLISVNYSENVVYPFSDNSSPATTTVVYEPVKETVTTEAHPVPDELTGDFIRERSLNATHYYDKLSADIYSFHAVYGQNLGDWESNGTVKIDNTAMNAEMYEEMYSGEREPWDRSYKIFLNNIYVYVNQNDIAAQNQHDEGKYCNIESVDTHYKRYKSKPDRPVLSGCLNFVDFEISKVSKDGIERIINETPWTVTGERYENGRRIASVSFSYEQLREGKYEPRYITADIDAETGLWLAYEIRTDHDYFGEGYLLESFKATNYKFNDEAEAPMTAKQVSDYLRENGYETQGNVKFDLN